MPQTEDAIVHVSPWCDWFATQDGRAVLIGDKASDQQIKVEPPREWGRHWAWNFTEDEAGVYFRRER